MWFIHKKYFVMMPERYFNNDASIPYYTMSSKRIQIKNPVTKYNRIF